MLCKRLLLVSISLHDGVSDDVKRSVGNGQPIMGARSMQCPRWFIFIEAANRRPNFSSSLVTSSTTLYRTAKMTTTTHARALTVFVCCLLHTHALQCWNSLHGLCKKVFSQNRERQNYVLNLNRSSITIPMFHRPKPGFPGFVVSFFDGTPCNNSQ